MRSINPPRRTGLVAGVAALALTGCTTERYGEHDLHIFGPVHITETPSVETVRTLPMYTGDDGTRMGWADLINAIEWADVIIVGEQHDDAVGHAVQTAIMQDTVAGWPGSALSLEMLERDEQPLIADYFEGIIDAKTFAKLSHSENWGAKGKWPDWYQPTIDAAKDGGGRVVAANAPRRYVKLARKEGYTRLDALPSARRRWVNHPNELPGGQYRERFWEIMSMPAIPEATPKPPSEGDEKAAEDAPTTLDESPIVDAEPTTEAGTEPAPETPAAEPEVTEQETEPPAQDAVESAGENEEVPTSQPAEAPTDDPEEVTTEELSDEELEIDEPKTVEDAADEEAADDDDETGEEAEGEPDGDDDKKMPPMAHVLNDQQIEAIFRSQLVWDATMAESIAQAKKSGAKKVVHLVGQFHCDFEGGTVQELRKRLPGSRILVISMQREWPEMLREEDRGRADIIIYTGERPEEPEEVEDEEAEAEEDKEAMAEEATPETDPNADIEESPQVEEETIEDADGDDGSNSEDEGEEQPTTQPTEPEEK